MYWLDFNYKYFSQITGDVSKVRESVKLAALQNNQTVQPYIILVGKLEKIQEIYFCLDSTLFQLNTVLEAIDVCFKAFFVFQLHYPVDSQHIWFLIQRGIYEIVTKQDVIFPSIEFVMSKLTRLKKKKYR